MKEIKQAILREIEAIKKNKPRLLIAIDGRCAAGKTTLAADLREALPCNVIHMDHFFLRREQRTPERLSEPGGNVDYERFLKEVLLPLKRGGDFSYRPYDCRRQAFGGAVSMRTMAVNIVEGAYSCHPELRNFYDLRIFLSVEPEEQLRRIRQRNGDERVADFKDKWIPLEEQYFLSCRVREQCGLLYNTDSI